VRKKERVKKSEKVMRGNETDEQNEFVQVKR
jgi:hypothetical protein